MGTQYRTEQDYDREKLKEKKRVVVKVGSSSLVHAMTGELDLYKLEQLVRGLCDLKNQGKDVVLVSSGAIVTGVKALSLSHKPDTIPLKQACASVGQAALIMIYQKLFNEYHQRSSQILLTKHTILDQENSLNARNTFQALFSMDVIPIVNENDTVATDEIRIGDNDTLSAVVAALSDADLMILLSDIDGLYTDDPNLHSDAQLIHCISQISDDLFDMAKGSSSHYGTGGMVTKLEAGRIASNAGCDMIIANGKDFRILHDIMEGEEVGTLFLAHKDPSFHLADCIEHAHDHRKM